MPIKKYEKNEKKNFTKQQRSRLDENREVKCAIVASSADFLNQIEREIDIESDVDVRPSGRVGEEEGGGGLHCRLHAGFWRWLGRYW